MEFISGKLLSDEIPENGPMRPERAVSVLTQVLDAVNYAHHNGIIHRDLKPDNIILVGDGSSLRIKVLDFGIARMIGGESLTLAGEGFGTPTYMAPERMTGAAGDDPRMDLYAAGIILFEMLTGKAPFESKASDPALYWVEMRELHQREPLPALGPFGVSAEIEHLAARATAKRLEDRYQSADEMLEELRGLSDTGANAPTVVLCNSRLLVSTTPGAADVYVDDVLRGISDAIRGRLLVDGLSAGLHSVRVLKEGFNEYKINVSLEEGRQTDLQVAIPARATVAMPPADNTAAGGLKTLKLEGADDVKTALLTVERLPAGTALFIGSQAVGSAGEDGRATLRLSPGEYEIRAATPTGGIGKQRVTVTAHDAASLMTMTLPLTQPTVRGEALPVNSPASRRGRQVAAAVVVILFLALATAAYFVFRGPNRNRSQVESVTVAPTQNPGQSDQGSSAVTLESSATADPHTSDDKKKAADAHRQAEQDATAIDAQKKTAEVRGKVEKKETSSQPAAPAVTQRVVPTPPPAAATEPERAGSLPGEVCVAVSVLDADGQPAAGVKVGLMDESAGGGPSARVGGFTGPKGRWLRCGLAAGHTIRVAALGPGGGLRNSQTAVTTSPRTFVTIHLQRRMEEAPQLVPGGKHPFRRRP